MEGSGRGPNGEPTQYFSGGTGNTTRTSFTIAGVPAEIRTEHLPYTNVERYLEINYEVSEPRR
jgi:hypothetical protein